MTYHQRKDGGWGMPVIHDNGTITVGPGVVKDLADGKADIIASGLNVLQTRSLIFTYSMPFYENIYAIFIPKFNVKQDFDFFVFFRPFARNTMICIQIVLLVSSGLVCLIWKPKRRNWKLYPEVFVKIFKFQLGAGDFPASWTETRSSTKGVLVVLLLMGNAFWLAYNGSLISSLVTPTLQLPFDDLDSFLLSDYK